MNALSSGGVGAAVPTPPASASVVHTPGMIRRVPNQPKTPIRGFRIPDELYAAARAKAAERGEDLSTVVRASLERYVKRK